MRISRLLAMLASICALATGSVVLTATPVAAGTGLVYQAVDADNDPYSGIYLRNTWTDFNNATRVTSRYMYYGNSAELICGIWGQSIGPYANRRWHKIYVLNGPATGQTGWMPDRYLNTPNKANQATPGEPECDANGNPPVVVPPAPSRMGAVYFSPYPQGQFVPDSWAATIPRDSWSTGTACSNSKMTSVPTYEPNSGRTVTTLAGWSLGRVGPLYYLQRFPDRRSTINYVVMIDPGSYDQLRTGCDWTINANAILYDWLKANPNAHLVIFAGAKTEDLAHRTYSNGRWYGHRGIQEVYFARIRGDASVANRVMVCNYQPGVQKPTNEQHQQMFWDFDQYIDKPPPTMGICPGGGTYWHP